MDPANRPPINWHRVACALLGLACAGGGVYALVRGDTPYAVACGLVSAVLVTLSRT